MVSNELMAPEQAQQMVQTNQAIMHATAAITGMVIRVGDKGWVGMFSFCDTVCIAPLF